MKLLSHSLHVSQRINRLGFVFLAGCASVFLPCSSASGQLVATGSDQVRVSLTEAALLPTISSGSIQTSIATSFGGNTSPWVATLRFPRRDASSGMVGYELQIKNASQVPLSLPIGTDGTLIWNQCKDASIAEVNIDLRVPGRVAPLASLPAVHSCSGVSSSAVSLLPGHYVIFSGTMEDSGLASERTDVSAVVSVCSAVYSVEGSNPHTTRTCQAPVTSNRTALSSTVAGRQQSPRVN